MWLAYDAVGDVQQRRLQAAAAPQLIRNTTTNTLLQTMYDILELLHVSRCARAYDCAQTPPTSCDTDTRHRQKLKLVHESITTIGFSRLPRKL